MDLYKKNNEPISQAQTGSLNSALLSKHFFNKDCVFLQQRTQKLTTAIHMVTDKLPDSEAMRTELRVMSLKLLSLSFSLEMTKGESQSQRFNEFDCSLRNTLALVELSKSVGLMGAMNADILAKELKNIEAYTTEYSNRKYNEEGVLMHSEKFAEVSLADMFPRFKTMNAQIGQDLSYKGHESRTENTKRQHEPNKKYRNPKELEIVLKSERRSAILNIVKNKGEIGVKDVSLVIKDYSEKTIQRELMSMVSEGILNKNGNKRWSKYSIRTK